MSLRDDILNFSGDPFMELRPESIPEWGGITVYYRGWTAKERDDMEAVFGDMSKSRENVRAKVLVRCLRDADGKLIFGDDDAAALGEKNSVVMDRLFTLVSRLNGITKDTSDDAKKNLQTTTSGGSTENSPTVSATPA